MLWAASLFEDLSPTSHVVAACQSPLLSMPTSVKQPPLPHLPLSFFFSSIFPFWADVKIHSLFPLLFASQTSIQLSSILLLSLFMNCFANNTKTQREEPCFQGNTCVTYDVYCSPGGFSQHYTAWPFPIIQTSDSLEQPPLRNSKYFGIQPPFWGRRAISEYAVLSLAYLPALRISLQVAFLIEVERHLFLQKRLLTSQSDTHWIQRAWLIQLLR